MVKTHYPFLDKKFVDFIIKSDVDYVIWFMPWKMIKNIDGKILHFPKCVIIEKNKIKENHLVDYNENLMISANL